MTGFGHLGDQNLHLNAVVPEYSEEVRFKGVCYGCGQRG